MVDDKIAAALKRLPPAGMSFAQVDARLKSTRHENSDHLDRALLVQKLKPSTTDGYVVGTNGSDTEWVPGLQSLLSASADTIEHDGTSVVRMPALQALTATATIDPANGRIVTFTGASGQTLTLPTDPDLGEWIEVLNIDTSDGVIVARGGTNTIIDNLTTGATQFRIPAGARAKFTCVASGVWLACYTSTVVNAGSFTPSAGTGNKSITGVGFRPKSLHVSQTLGTDGARSRFQMGWGDADGTMFFGTGRTDDGGASGSQSGGGAMFGIAGLTGAMTDWGTLVSMDEDGFTLNFSNNANGLSMSYLAIA